MKILLSRFLILWWSLSWPTWTIGSPQEVSRFLEVNLSRDKLLWKACSSGFYTSYLWSSYKAMVYPTCPFFILFVSLFPKFIALAALAISAHCLLSSSVMGECARRGWLSHRICRSYFGNIARLRCISCWSTMFTTLRDLVMNGLLRLGEVCG